MLMNQFCTADVAFCTRDTTVFDAAQSMRRKHVGALIVVDDPDEELRPVGVITDRDIAVNVVAADLNVHHTPVSEIMRTPVVTASEAEDSQVVVSRMRDHGVRRLPITDDRGRLIGIATLDDILKRLRTEVDSLLDLITVEQDHERLQRRK